MSFSEEWEAQQEANRLIARLGGLGDGEEENSSKYGTYQPAVFATQSQRVAEYLIVKGFTFLNVETLGGGWSFVFASRGEEPAKTARLFAEGKLSLEESPRMEVASGQAQERIRAAIGEFTHQQNLRAG